MTMRTLLLGLLFLSGACLSQNTVERVIQTTSLSNSLENPDSYKSFDNYKLAKEKNLLVYGRDYIFSGIPISAINQALIDEVDPYSYLPMFSDYTDVSIPIDELDLVLILYARKVQRVIKISEND